MENHKKKARSAKN